MRLTTRGRVVGLTVLFAITALVGFLTAPYAIDYSGGIQVVDVRELSSCRAQ